MAIDKFSVNEPFELSGGMKSVIAVLAGLFGWLLSFIIGKLLLSIVFIEVSTALMVIWGILAAAAICFAVGFYIDQEIY